MVSGFLLGLANGVTCLATCAAVLVPLLLGEGRPVRENSSLLVRFLAGRLAGYLLFGLLAWAVHWVVLLDPRSRSIVFGAAYLLLAAMMLAYGAGKLKISCAITPRQFRTRLGEWGWWGSRIQPLVPALFGLLTGVNLCPPFLLAFTNAALNATLMGSLLFFTAFFAGTSLYLLPMPFLGMFRGGSTASANALQTVGKLAAVLMSFYYVYSGILMFLQGAVL